MLALLLFRIVWGFIGSDTARFGQFLKTLLAALRHLSQFFRVARRRANEAGGWMVIVLLLLLLVQVGTGLCANDDGSTEGRWPNMSARR